MWRILLVVLILLPATAGAQRNLAVAPTEQRVALVIGNSAYKDSPLANPANDAADIAKALQQVGFKVILKRNAGTRDMRQAIREFGAELRRAQVGLFYFAGHGVQVKGNNYLVPVGADIESEADAEDLAIDANYALRTMEEAQVKVSIVILDACRNNPFARSFRSSARGLAQMSAATGSVIAFATAPGSVAADGKGRNGTYTKHLLASLAQPDTDILKVFQRTRAGVVKETGGKQTPWESTSLVGDFYFRPPAAGAAAAPISAPQAAADPAAIELDFWNSVKDSKSADELNAYLDQYPNGRYVALARVRLKTLAATPAAPPAQVAAVAPSSVVSPSSSAPAKSFRDCEVCPEMVLIPAGSFLMGSRELEYSQPEHQVTISRSFAAGKYEVTFDEWDACVSERGCNPIAGGDRGRHPVNRVSWHDANKYVQWLASKTGASYRLLSEAEWEYVARAGTTTRFHTGATITLQQANFKGAGSYAGSPAAVSPGKTVPVGSYAPNAFGLHDVHGNVVEWVEDCMQWDSKRNTTSNYNGAPTDGRAWTSVSPGAPYACHNRMLRGGSYSDGPDQVQSARRSHSSASSGGNNFGFRVARTN